MAGGGTVRVDPGAEFKPGTLATFGRTRFDLGADAEVIKAELHENTGDGGRFGNGELKASGSSLLLRRDWRRPGHGLRRPAADGGRLDVEQCLRRRASLRTTGPVDWRLGGVNLDGECGKIRTITLSNGWPA